MKKLNKIRMFIMAIATMLMTCVLGAVSAFASDGLTPATGDETNLPLLFIVLGVAAVGMIVTVIVVIVKNKKN